MLYYIFCVRLKEARAIVHVRVRRRIVNIRSKQPVNCAVPIVATAFEDAPTKDGAHRCSTLTVPPKYIQER